MYNFQQHCGAKKLHSLSFSTYHTMVLVLFFLSCAPVTVMFKEEVSEKPPEFEISTTEGVFDNRVILSWKAVPNTKSYTIYRSEKRMGPYKKIATVYSNNPKNKISEAERVTLPQRKTSTVDYSKFFNFSYTTEVDIHPQDGVYWLDPLLIPVGQEAQLRIIIGSSNDNLADYNFVVHFPSLNGGKTRYTREMIISRINSVASMQALSKGKTPVDICRPDDENENRIVFESRWGPIVFKNEKNTTAVLFFANIESRSPIKSFIRRDVEPDQIFVVNKDGGRIINKEDYSGNLNDYLGEPVLIKAKEIPWEFPDGHTHFFHDMNVTVDKRYYHRVVASEETGVLLTMSKELTGRTISLTAPLAPQDLKASEGTFSDKVRLSWKPVSGSGITYTIYRTPVFSLGDFIKPLTQGLTDTYFEDKTVPAGNFSYRVVAYNEKGEEGHSSDSISGYRQATVEEFTHLAYYETVEAENKMAQSLGKNRIADYESQITRKLEGNLNGTVTYNLRISGVSGTGYWTFKDYKNYNLTLNGSTSMDSGMSKNGKPTGTINVSGIYTGSIEYNLIVRSGNVSGGYFSVAYNGNKTQRIDYTSRMNHSPY